MRLAVITCEAYRDAVKPFLALLQKFWPDCPYPVKFHSENYPGETWCSVVARCAQETVDDEILMMLEDYFLTAPVQQHLIEHGLEEMQSFAAGCVRLYPCPGAEVDTGDPYFGLVPRGTRDRISTMAAIWKPSFLYDVAVNSQSTTGTAGDFENLGSPFSSQLAEPVLAFKREIEPWPMTYLCSAIGRGEWSPDAITLCAEHGIELDRSMRPVASVG